MDHLQVNLLRRRRSPVLERLLRLPIIGAGKAACVRPAQRRVMLLQLAIPVSTDLQTRLAGSDGMHQVFEMASQTSAATHLLPRLSWPGQASVRCKLCWQQDPSMMAILCAREESIIDMSSCKKHLLAASLCANLKHPELAEQLMRHAVVACNKLGHLLEQFPRFSSAARQIGIDSTVVGCICKWATSAAKDLLHLVLQPPPNPPQYAQLVKGPVRSEVDEQAADGQCAYACCHLLHHVMAV